MTRMEMDVDIMEMEVEWKWKLNGNGRKFDGNGWPQTAIIDSGGIANFTVSRNCDEVTVRDSPVSSWSMFMM